MKKIGNQIRSVNRQPHSVTIIPISSSHQE